MFTMLDNGKQIESLGLFCETYLCRNLTKLNLSKLCNTFKNWRAGGFECESLSGAEHLYVFCVINGHKTACEKIGGWGTDEFII